VQPDAHQFLQVWFVELDLPRRESTNFFDIRVDAHHVVTDIGKPCRSRETDVSSTDYHDSFRST
jgi:hypothetical protein